MNAEFAALMLRWVASFISERPPFSCKKDRSVSVGPAKTSVGLGRDRKTERTEKKKTGRYRSVLNANTTKNPKNSLKNLKIRQKSEKFAKTPKSSLRNLKIRQNS